MFSFNCRPIRLRLIFGLTLFIFSLITLNFFGIIDQFYEVDFDSSFTYPYNGNIDRYIRQIRAGEEPQLPPLNTFRESILEAAAKKCQWDSHLVLVVKSAQTHLDRRIDIRKSWGGRNKFPGVNITTVFILGVSNDENIRRLIRDEIKVNHDIVVVDVFDTYFNNTLKTINSMKWALNYCNNSNYYLFIDDDMYLSVRNVLRFIYNPYTYPNNAWNVSITPRILYAGNVEHTYPRREKNSKWHVPLQEYPFNKWPPFIPAGCYILSNEALELVYYRSMYTKMFRFDDIFLSLVAYNAGIKMIDSEHFHMHTDPNAELDFRNMISFHGFADPFRIWLQQNEFNNF